MASASRPAAWRKYQQVFSTGLQDTFVYRWNFLLRAFFGLVPLFGTVYIWEEIFESRGRSIGTYDFGTMIFYFLLVIVADTLVTPTEDEWRIAAEIRDGQLSALITKPLDHLAYRLSLFLSYRLLYGIATLPVLVAVFWWFRDYLRVPVDPWTTWPLFTLSLTMAALLQFFIAYSLAMLAFWLLEISTVVFILYSFEYFLSGQIFPLDLLPPALQGFVKWSPFTYELFFPVQVYMERVRGGALWEGLLIQAGWVILAYFMARGLWRLGIRKYQAVGA